MNVRSGDRPPSILSLEIGHMLGEPSCGLLSSENYLETRDLCQQRFEKFLEKLGAEEYAVSQPLHAQDDLDAIREVGEELRGGYSTILVVAIGGSALGFRAILQALKGPFHNVFPGDDPQVFVVDNVDPSVAHELGEQLDFSKTMLVYISKSGSTPEPAANFIYFLDKLHSAGGDEKDVVVMCDEADNGINKIAARLDCRLLHIPKELGGRYSVLSCVSLLPSELLGIDSKLLIEGAKRAHEAVLFTPIGRNPCFVLGSLLHAYFRADRRTHFLFAYSNRLAEFGLWLTQLWGESLGKLVNLRGEEVRNGTLPALGIGATDQHSILQLLKEGPRDKVLGYLKIGMHREDTVVPRCVQEMGDLMEYAYFSGQKMGEQLGLEQISSEISTQGAGNPCYSLTIERLDELCLGALFYYYELLVIYLAALDEVNPFDQPGVESGKDMTYALMGRPDYAGMRGEQGRLLKDYHEQDKILTI